MVFGRLRSWSRGRLRRRLESYRRARSLLSRRDLLAPGLYVKDTPILWRRIGTELPDFLRSTKGPSRNEPRQRLRTPRLPIPVRGAGAAELVVATFEGGAVYLDRANARVTRVYPPGVEADPRQVELRRRFELHTGAPKATYAPDARSHVEEYVPGVHLYDLSAADRLVAVGNLLSDYVRLTVAEGEGDASADILTAIDACSEVVLPVRLRRLAGEAAQLVGSIRIPWVPSAREANLKNLVVRRDLTVSPIDLGDLTLLPSIWYPLGIVCGAGPDVVTAFCRGHFDDRLEALYTGGPKPRRPSAWREQFIAARIIYASWWDARASASSAAPHRLDAGIYRRWQVVATVLNE